LLPLAALLGAVAGLAQLTRSDAMTLLPVLALSLWWAPASRRKRLAALGVCGLMALAVFAPWPLRNLRQFGEPYPTATFWRTLSGRPLPTTIVAWARTWSDSSPGESYLDVPIYYDRPLAPTRPEV